MTTDSSERRVDRDPLRTWYGYALAKFPRIPWTACMSPGLRYYTENEWFPVSDAWLLAGMIHMHRPKRIIEVGAGFSTAAMMDACIHSGTVTNITCVDPRLRRVWSLLRANDRVELIEAAVQMVIMKRFESLNQGDILFIDSSHVDGEGTDVDFLIRSVLPRLKSGVMVHFHDIFPGFKYPPQWQMRGYTEAEAVQELLDCDPLRYRVVAFNALAGERYPALFEEMMPAFLQHTGGSLWLEIQ